MAIPKHVCTHESNHQIPVMKDGLRRGTYCEVLDCLGTVLLGLLVRLSVLRMADGLVTLEDEVNLKGA